MSLTVISRMPRAIVCRRLAFVDLIRFLKVCRMSVEGCAFVSRDATLVARAV